ncbi:MBG domain-containing protein [Chitinophaga tropicalis]|uniref:T9SS type B sorting domain-containing protein n=1 Tax=Chitinophaga tropicalis TaxID=2683588 RepID=A0A7K1U0J1_9BACT|nr:MBG domain-containing protein [Chitinophaga tropicalis]MVT07879.1 T9SS type B sorting domain-containing protein [Chitinophaga tropicalis]
MKLTLLRIVVYLLLLSSTVQYVQAQTITAGDLLFTGINTFDDDNNGSTQNDAFSFVFLRNCPANTEIYFTDLGWTGTGFQSTSCAANTGSQTDGVIRWSSGSTLIKAGQQVVISCKYSPSATIGTVTNITATKASSSQYISLGLAGDQLFAFTGTVAAPSIIAGININRKTWETSLDPCDFTSSSSVKPATTALLKFPDLTTVNARYNCNTTVGSSARLRSLILDTLQWNKDNTLSAPAPTAFSLKNTAPCNLTIVNPDAGGIVYVNKQSATPGDGSSWTSPLPELRDALNAAADPANGISQVWVAKGTYKPAATADPAASFTITSALSVYGGFAGNEATLNARNIPANPVILSGDLASDDILNNGIVLQPSDIRGTNSYQVMTIGNVSGQVVLDGLIITGGNATGATVDKQSGAGLYCSDANVSVTNTRFHGNAANLGGGAIYNTGSRTMQLTNSVISGNGSAQQGGAIQNANGTLRLINATISGNTGFTQASGVAMSNGSLVAYNSIISGNTSAWAGVTDIYFSATATKDINYSILGDQYYTNTTTQQTTPAVTFTDAANGDLRLTLTNFAINRGDPQTNNSGYTAQAGTLDLGGQTRISNTVIDLGAYEIQAQAQTITFPTLAPATYGDENIALQATTTGDATITYTSGNTAVAQIVNGKIKTTGAGTAVITANAGATNTYLPATATRTITVNKKGLIVTADDKQRSYGVNNPALTYTYNGFVYTEDATVLTGTPQLSTIADATSAPGTYPITAAVGTLSSANYSFTFTTGTLTINQASQTIDFPAIANKTYGDAAFTLSATSTSGLPVTYSLVGGPATLSGNTVTITGTGNVTIAADQPGDANYTAATRVTQTFTINKAALTVTANNKTKTYLQANPALDYTITGFVNGENNSVVSGTAAISTTADASSTPGTYPITLGTGTLNAANYSFNLVDGTLTIGQASQTITFPAITNKTYGDAPFTLNASSTSGLPVTYAITSGPAAISGNTLTITGAGSVTVTASQPGDANYSAATAVSTTFLVTPATLTVTAENKQRAYGLVNPVLTYTITGFVNGEDNSVISGAPAISTNANASSSPGAYPIVTATGTLSAANYNFSLANGTLLIAQASQTINFPAIANKTYGNAQFTLSATSTSGLPVTYSLVGGPVILSGNTVTITGTGNVTIAVDQPGDVNYRPATTVTQTFTVNKAVLTVTAKDLAKNYLAPNPILGYIITGYVNGENGTVVSGTAALSTTATVNSTPGTYPITVGAGSLTAANYSFSFVDGTLTIGQASQTITFPALTNKTYGDAPFTLSATSTSGLPVTYVVTSGPAIVNGNTLTITGAGSVTVTATQPGDANYTAATAVSNTFNVGTATLTVTADDKQKAYGVANPALTYTITGFVNGDDDSVIGGAPVLNTNADASSLAGNYPITIAAGTLSSANYVFTTVNGTLTVGQAPQTITFPAVTDKAYGDATFTLNATSNSGLPVSYSIVSGPATVNGNTVTITGAGIVTIAANQAGDASYFPATQATRSFNVNKASLTVTAANDTRTYNGTAYTGGNGVTYAGFVNGDNAAKLGGSITYTGSAQGAVNAGAYVITPAGLTSNDYSITYTDGQLTITKATQQITFSNPGNKNQGDPDFTLVATSTSGLSVTFSTNNTQVISVNGNIAHVGVAGSVTITASQAGDNNYEPAQAVTQTIEVSAWSAPVITAQGNTTFCAGGTITLQSSEAPAYEWYRDGSQVAGAAGRSLTVNQGGSYTVKAIYGNFSVTSSAVTVVVNPLPDGDIQLTGESTISKGETIRLTASGGSSYTWSPVAGLTDAQSAETDARPAATTTYQVTITNNEGCSVTKEITITVKDDYQLEATNILTPNGDGKNDLWIVKNIDMYPQNEVKIYDRAGRLIYRQQGYTNNWNGTVNGQRLAEGTYYYIIDLGDNKPRFKGFITIIHRY